MVTLPCLRDMFLTGKAPLRPQGLHSQPQDSQAECICTEDSTVDEIQKDASNLWFYDTVRLLSKYFTSWAILPASTVTRSVLRC